MISTAYLYRGLCGLAHAYRANPMAGHLGAALVAGYFLGEELPHMDERVRTGVTGELDRILNGEENMWFNPQETGITNLELFEPIPSEPSQETGIPAIAEALCGNIDKMRESGHNAIFAAIAIRALRDHPQFATPTILHGIRRLIEDFNDAIPGRGYYGRERGWIEGDQVRLQPVDEPAPYTDEAELAEAVIAELIQGASVPRRGFGGLVHVINHAAALVELSRFGYRDLARSGLRAHWHHVRLWKSLPDLEDELGPVERATHDPRAPEYWTIGTLRRDSGRLTHRIKTLYGFITLMRLVEDEAKRRAAEAQFLYLMA
jgi:hypothetical protein